jgi:lipopolysaccharide biosynthesis regulator YciM
MSVRGSRRFETDGSFSEFCQILEKKDQLQDGQSLHPSRLFIHIHQFYPELTAIQARGSGVDFANGLSGSVESDPGEFDQSRSGLLLGDVRQAKIDFPNVAKKYRAILARAESIWTALLNKVKVGV